MKTNIPTYGACAARLRSNGYELISAIAPLGAEYDGNLTSKFVAWEPHEISEHPVAVRLQSPTGTLTLLVLNPAAIADPELLERVRAVLEKSGLTAGPCRTGSDGRETYALRAGYSRAAGSALGDAVTFGRGTLLPLDGRWERGDLLNVTRAELPEVDADTVRAVCADLNGLPYRLAQERRPPPQPSLEAWIGQ